MGCTCTSVKVNSYIPRNVFCYDDVENESESDQVEYTSKHACISCLNQNIYPSFEHPQKEITCCKCWSDKEINTLIMRLFLTKEMGYCKDIINIIHTLLYQVMQCEKELRHLYLNTTKFGNHSERFNSTYVEKKYYHHFKDITIPTYSIMSTSRYNTKHDVLYSTIRFIWYFDFKSIELVIVEPQVDGHSNAQLRDTFIMDDDEFGGIERDYRFQSFESVQQAIDVLTYGDWLDRDNYLKHLYRLVTYTTNDTLVY